MEYLFLKYEFYSTLKGKDVSDDEHDNSKKLYRLLKIRNLSDLNNLYNAQDNSFTRNHGK